MVPKLAVPWLVKATSPSCSGRPGGTQPSQNAAVRSPRSEGLPMVAVYCQPFQHWGLFQAVHGHVRALQQFGFMISAPGGFSASSFPPKNPQGLWDYLHFGSLLSVLLACSPCGDTSLPDSEEKR